MNYKNTYKLLKRFPVLYQGFYDDLRNTAMVWGFDHGDGWFDLIWQLSLDIEKELSYSWLRKQYYLSVKKASKRWNQFVAFFSPYGQKDKLGKFFNKIYGQYFDSPDPMAIFESRWYLLGMPWSRLCLGWKMLLWHPYTGFAVSQVKEKYAQLCYYCPCIGNIEKLVDEAEEKSAYICETCGKPGKIRGHGWLYTACPEHSKPEDLTNDEISIKLNS